MVVSDRPSAADAWPVKQKAITSIARSPKACQVIAFARVRLRCSRTIPSSTPCRRLRSGRAAVEADVDAPPAFEFDGRGKNVVLVVLESVSGNYLETAARHHGRRAINGMPRLDRVFA